MPCSTLVLLVYRKCTKVDCRYNTHQCRAHTGARWGHVVNTEPEAASSYWVTVVLTRPTKWSQLKRRGGSFCLPSSCRLRLSDPPQPNDISSPVSSAAARPRFPHWPKALCVNGQIDWLHWSAFTSRIGILHQHSQNYVFAKLYFGSVRKTKKFVCSLTAAIIFLLNVELWPRCGTLPVPWMACLTGNAGKQFASSLGTANVFQDTACPSQWQGCRSVSPLPHCSVAALWCTLLLFSLGLSHRFYIVILSLHS